MMTRPGKLLTVATLAIAITGASCRAGSIEIVQDISTKQGLLAYWPLDELAGTMAVHDASEKKPPYDGTLLGTTMWIPDGRFDGALRFEQGGEVQVGSFPMSMPTALPNLSVALWVRPTAADLTQEYATLISTEKAGMGGWEMNIHSSTRAGVRSTLYEFGFFIGPAMGDYFWIDCACVEVGKWTHLAAVVDSVSGVSLYVNGANHPTVTMFPASVPRGPIKPGNTTLRLGSWELEATQPRGFKGDLDDIYIYDRALLSDNISILYYRQIAPIPSDGGDAGGEPEMGGVDAPSSTDRNPDRNPDQ